MKIKPSSREEKKSISCIMYSNQMILQLKYKDISYGKYTTVIWMGVMYLDVSGFYIAEINN